MSNVRDQEGNQDVARISQDNSQQTLAIRNACESKTLNTVLTVVAVLGFVSIIAFFASADGGFFHGFFIFWPASFMAFSFPSS